MASKDFAFRRVHGKVIPIRLKKSNRGTETKKGAALAGAGVVTAATSGNLAARATKEAAKFRINAKVYSQKAQSLLKKVSNTQGAGAKLEKAGQMAFEFKIKPRAPRSEAFAKIALRNTLKSNGFKLLRKGLHVGGLATSTALLGTGFKKLYEGISGDKADTKQEIISTAAGAGATFALSSAYAHKLMGGGRKNLVQAVKIGLRAAKIKI